MSNVWSATVADWQGVDDEPTVGSGNLVKSGGVADAISKNVDTIVRSCRYRGNITVEDKTVKFGVGYIFLYTTKGNYSIKITEEKVFENIAQNNMFIVVDTANRNEITTRNEGTGSDNRFNIITDIPLLYWDSNVVYGYLANYLISKNADTISKNVDTISKNVDTISKNVDTISKNADTIICKNKNVQLIVGQSATLAYKMPIVNREDEALYVTVLTTSSNRDFYVNIVAYDSNGIINVNKTLNYSKGINAIRVPIEETSESYSIYVRPISEEFDVVFSYVTIGNNVYYQKEQLTENIDAILNEVNREIKEIVIRGALYEGDVEIIRNTSTYTTKDVYDSQIVGDVISQGIILYCKINGITSPDKISVDLYNGKTRLSINYFENGEKNLIIPDNCNRVIVVARAFGGEEGDIRSFSGISIRTNADNKEKTLLPDISIQNPVSEDLLYFPKKYVLPSYAKPSDAIQPIIHGATKYYPQNCATLYKLASKNRFNFWENDVRPCVDNYVLAHNDDMAGYALDENGDPISGNSWICSQKTLTELKTLKVGILPNTTTIVSGFENDKILSFEEYIILAKSYCAVPVIEIKFNATQSQVGELYAIVLKHGMQNSVIWNCYSNRFNHADYIKALNPKAYFLFTFYPPQESISMKTNINTCKTYETFSGQVMVSLPWDSWSDKVDGVILKDYANSLGLRLATWATLNSTYKAQIEAGVCGFCSNMGAGLEDNPYYYLQKNYI